MPAARRDDANPIERLLLDAVRAAFARAGAARVAVEREPLAALLEAIQGLALDDAERALLAAHPGEDAAAELARMDRWIELRLGRALTVACERVAAAAGVPTPAVPRVVVVRGGLDASARRGNGRAAARSDDPSTGTRAIASAPGDVLVLADASGVDRVLERHKSLWIGAKNVRLRFRGGLDDRHQTVGLAPAPGADGVEVVETPTVLRELGMVLERARVELEEAPPPPAPPPSVEDLAGTVLGGKYELLSRIGRGGFGSVYRARDLRLDHCVAVKMLDREGRSLAALTALRDEARRLTRLDHPNIVDWKTFDEAEDGTGYIVMELLEGEDLEEVLRRERRLPPRRVAHVLHEIAQALCAAHTLDDGGSILHLDLKPRNVFVLASTDARGRDRVKVIDFGIAQHGARAAAWPGDGGSEDFAYEPDGTLRSARAAALPVLADGSARAAACTPEYAAPEHVAHLLPDAAASALDGRADLYSLGVIGFQLLSGALPFDAAARDRGELLRVKTTTPAPSVVTAAPDVPRDLARFVDRCLELDRERRYASAEEACEALRRIVERTSARRWIAAAVASAALSAGVVWRARDAAAPQLEAFVQASDGERPVAGERLCFGPDSPPVRLRVEDADARSPLAGARLVASCDAGAPDVEGSAVVLTDADEVEVRVAGWSDATARGAFLETRREDGARRYSAAFAVVFVPHDALCVEAAGFDGLDGRALDPRGARLDVAVAGRVDLVERVDVADGALRLEARADGARTHDRSAVWTLDPTPFAWSDGARDLVVEVVDVAGGIRRRALRVDVVATDLAWSVDSDAPRFGERWSLSPDTSARAAVRANRRADFAWRALDEAGTTLASGRRSETDSFELDLRQVVEAAGGRSFDGHLELAADESRFVRHARATGDAARRVPIQFRAEPPALRAWIAPCAGRPETALEPGAVVYAPCRSFDLRVARDCEQPVRYEVAVGALTPRRGELRDRLRASEGSTITVESDGAYAVRVRGWQIDAAPRGDDAPDFERAATVVVQSRATRLALGGPSALVVRGDDALPPLVVRAEPPAGWSGGAAAPVSCRWTLIGPGPREVAATGVVGDVASGGSAELDVALPDGDELDGAWRVEVAGTDAAGHESPAASFAFHVARQGPRAEVLVPLANAPWDRGDGGFELRVAARDANGVARVACRVRRAGVDAPPIDVELERDGSSAVGSLWRGRVDLPASWSRAPVEIVVACEDGYGIAAELAVARDVARIDADLPGRIRVAFGDHAVAPMRLVRGNDGGTYVFGGRGDDLENDLFRRAGLYAFNALRTARSWRVVVPAGSIRDYYLDEREVTVAEYLEFVRAPDGYADARRWPAGASPRDDRRRELLARLATEDARLPVADVDWSEAAAYARWVGKRLPSALEWEHALRGGSAYRPHAAWDPARAGAQHEHLLADRAHAAGELGDVTPDTRIADLSGNVAEWTSTPAVAATPVESAPEDASPAAKRWVAGGSWTSARRDFSTLDRRRGDARAHAIGFRCCLSASELLERLEDRDEPRFESSP